jgi:hypothetical protein
MNHCREFHVVLTNDTSHYSDNSPNHFRVPLTFPLYFFDYSWSVALVDVAFTNPTLTLQEGDDIEIHVSEEENVQVLQVQYKKAVLLRKNKWFDVVEEERKT